MHANSPDSCGESRQDAARGPREVHQQYVDNTLAAIQRLEKAYRAAAPGRESSWLADIYTALLEVDRALCQQNENADNPNSVLSEIERTEPRLTGQIAALRERYRTLRQETSELMAVLDPARGDARPGYAEVRERLNHLLNGVRNYWAAENDLFFEAYEADVGAGD